MTTKQLNALLEIFKEDNVTRIDLYTTVGTFFVDPATIRSDEELKLVVFERFKDSRTMAIPVEEIKATVIVVVD